MKYALIALLTLASFSHANDKIKSVMKTHFKGETSDIKGAGAGTLDKAAMDKLAAAVRSIATETPPKGSTPAYKEKMGALADALSSGNKGKIKMSANCKACHDVHK
jgi:hypothetical protein